MAVTSCGYTKIADISSATQTLATNANIDSSNSFSQSQTIQTQSNNQIMQQQIAENNILVINENLNVPFYLILFMFLVFVGTMSVIYIYHLLNYSLDENVNKNFVPGILALLFTLLVPLLSKIIL